MGFSASLDTCSVQGTQLFVFSANDRVHSDEGGLCQHGLKPTPQINMEKAFNKVQFYWLLSDIWLFSFRSGFLRGSSFGWSVILVPCAFSLQLVLSVLVSFSDATSSTVSLN
eukprot:4311178-Amphidinium_carterae.1